MGESGGTLRKDADSPARPSRLGRITLEGYKSFQKETVDFGDVLLSGCRAFHFHDTSSQANIRRHHYIEDARYLRHDAGNLGPVSARPRANPSGLLRWCWLRNPPVW